MEPTLAATLTQFGVAGLIGWMWLAERRTAAIRDKQLSDAHDRILDQHAALDLLVSVIDHNTRAMTALEHTQHRLIDLLTPVRPGSPAAPAHVPALSPARAWQGAVGDRDPCPASCHPAPTGPRDVATGEASEASGTRGG